ncbi:MAG: amino acid ABC transporter substrate-binding protein [Magnetovibrio sp.]|nr:amino acid ABC transporter substrate-binding protein [Magnetovibrio sp.]
MPVTVIGFVRFLTLLTLFVNVLLLSSTHQALANATLDKVILRQHLLCSTAGQLYAGRDYKKTGDISGFDRDFCRAIAAAVLKNSSAIKFVFLGTSNRFQALQEKAVDVLISSTTWTLTRDASLGLHFAAINFYDGQGFVAHKSFGIHRLADLKTLKKKATVCVEKNTTTQINVKNYIKTHNLPIEIVEFNVFEELRYAFVSNRCDFFTADQSFLIEFLVSETPSPEDYVILEDIISKEPLSLVVRDDDANWFNIVRWTVFALIQAEELGISSTNADTLKRSGTVDQKRLLGTLPGVGKPLGLDDEWIYRIIKSVGNYGEIFARNFGAKTPYNLKRGANRLWTQGGLLYAPPFN